MVLGTDKVQAVSLGRSCEEAPASLPRRMRLLALAPSFFLFPRPIALPFLTFLFCFCFFYVLLLNFPFGNFVFFVL